jgi:putative FmdB family regulatory protein
MMGNILPCRIVGARIPGVLIGPEKEKPMPTYQYRCADCGHFFEIVQSFSDDSLTECPECTGRLRKVFNAVGVHFKGSGFYKTDSGSSSKPASSSSSSDSKSAAAPASS